jgi:Ubiquitin-2 like Rad60 SUMO-like
MAASSAMSESGLWLPGASTKEDKIEKWWEVNRKHDPPLTRGATPLVERCMRVLGWNETFAKRSLKGYRQFMELKSVMNDWQETKLSAPIAIQQMWEQHLLDNLNYTDDCFLLFGRVIGHDPDCILNDRATHDRIKTTRIAFQARYGTDLDSEVWNFGGPDADGMTIDAEEPQQQYHVGQSLPTGVTPRGRLPVAGIATMPGSGGYSHSMGSSSTAVHTNHHGTPLMSPGMNQPMYTNQMHSTPLPHEQANMSPRARSLVSSEDENSPIVGRAASPPRATTRNVAKSNPRSPKSPSGNDPITIFLRDTNSGEETYFSLRYRSTLRIVFTVFAERKGLNQDSLKFAFNGQSLTGYETPYSLGLEDRARIDVQIGQR